MQSQIKSIKTEISLWLNLSSLFYLPVKSVDLAVEGSCKNDHNYDEDACQSTEEEQLSFAGLIDLCYDWIREYEVNQILRLWGLWKESGIVDNE